MAGGGVRTDINDSVARVIFFHPKSNSLPGKVLADLAGEFNRLKDDKSIKVIILQSEGEKAFCAGASFDELLAINDFDTGKEFFMGFARVINAMRKCPQFIIARVQGKAVGGGVGLIAAADYALAVENALIKLSEFALGIGPFVVGPAVERKIGRAAFSQISIDYEWYDSDWSKEKGLFAETFATIEELDNGVTALAEKLAKNSPEASAAMKKIFWQGSENWDELLEQRAEISGRLVLSDFTKEYIRKFKGK